MRDIYQVLREKEQALARVRQEVEALRCCLPLLAEADTGANTQISSSTGTNHRRSIDAETSSSPTPFQN